MSREIDEILNIESEPIVQQAKNAIAAAETSIQNLGGFDPRFEEDFDFVRNNTKDIVQEVRKNVLKLSLIADDTEKAAHYSALASLTKVLLEANRQMIDLFEMKKKYHDVKGARPSEHARPTGDGVAINNAVFVGTTKDFKRMIRDMKSKEEDGLDSVQD